MTDRKVTRRDVAAGLGSAGLGSAGLGVAGATTTALGGAIAAPLRVRQAKLEVVIVGGGVAGLSVARALSAAAADALKVSLIAPDPAYDSCLFEAAILGPAPGRDTQPSSYRGILGWHGVDLVSDFAIAVDRNRKQVLSASGAVFAYDRLVLAPGVTIDREAHAALGPEASLMLNAAWDTGADQRRLAGIIDAMKPGGLVAIVAPPGATRWTEGVLERSWLVAGRLARRNPTATVHLILPSADEALRARSLLMRTARPGPADGTPREISVTHLAGCGWGAAVDPVTRRIDTADGVVTADVISAVPSQRAGLIAEIAGLVDESGWCPVGGPHQRSVIDDAVFIAGDAASGASQHRTAWHAARGAAAVAEAVLAEVLGPRAAANAGAISLAALADVLERLAPPAPGGDPTLGGLCARCDRNVDALACLVSQNVAAPSGAWIGDA